MQAVYMAAVRHSLPVLSYRGEDVAFDQGDPLIVIGEDARREQPGYAPANNNGML